MEGTLIIKELKEGNFPAVKKYYIIKVERMHLVSSRVNDSRQFFFTSEILYFNLRARERHFHTYQDSKFTWNLSYLIGILQ